MRLDPPAGHSRKPQAPPDSDPAPLVTISLPTSVTSETVQIRYFLIGPFGGRSDYVKSGVGLRSYQIRAYPEEKAAQSVKIVIYAPACEFQTLDLSPEIRICKRILYAGLCAQSNLQDSSRKNLWRMRIPSCW